MHDLTYLERLRIFYSLQSLWPFESTQIHTLADHSSDRMTTNSMILISIFVCMYVRTCTSGILCEAYIFRFCYWIVSKWLYVAGKRVFDLENG